MTNRLFFIHALRAVACLLVVYKHLIDRFWVSALDLTKKYHFEMKNFNSFENEYYSNIIISIDKYFSAGAFGVALFFLVSGFVIPLSLEKKTKVHFLLSRFFRIWPVYIVSLIITVIVVFFYKKFFNHDATYDFSLKKLVLNMTISQRLFGVEYFFGVLWTLEMEVKFYVFTVLAWWIFGGLYKFRYLMSISLLMICLTFLRFLTLEVHSKSIIINFISENVIHCSPFYLTYMYIGTCFYNHYKANWNLKKTILNILILSLVCLFMAYYYHPKEWRPLRLSAYIQAFVFFSLFYYLKSYIPYNKTIDFLGNISYPFYLIHSRIGYVFMAFIYYHTSSIYISLMFSILLLISLSYFLHVNVELPYQNYAKKLLNKIKI